MGDQASFIFPRSIIWEPKTRKLFVIDSNSIRMITLRGVMQDAEVITVAGATDKGYVDAVGTIARFNLISSITVESVEYYSNEWIRHFRDQNCFLDWPPGLLDIVIVDLPSIVTLIASEQGNKMLRRVRITF